MWPSGVAAMHDPTGSQLPVSVRIDFVHEWCGPAASAVVGDSGHANPHHFSTIATVASKYIFHCRLTNCLSCEDINFLTITQVVVPVLLLIPSCSNFSLVLTVVRYGLLAFQSVSVNTLKL